MGNTLSTPKPKWEPFPVKPASQRVLKVEVEVDTVTHGEVNIGKGTSREKRREKEEMAKK